MGSAKPLEGLKESLDVLGRNAGAGVTDTDTQRVGCYLLDGGSHPPILTIVLYGIGEKVEQHLAEPLPVCHHVPVQVLRKVVDLNLSRARQGTYQVQHLRQNVTQTNRLKRKLKLSGLDPRYFQDLV